MNLEEIRERLPEDEAVGDVMVRLRLRTGIRTNSQLGELLANIIGVKRSTITRWLSGARCSVRNTKQHLRCLQLVELLLSIEQPTSLQNSIPTLKNLI